MKAVVVGVTAVVLAGALVAFTHPETEPGPQGAPWAVAAPRDVTWQLDCRFVPVKVRLDAYNRDWVNQMAREGSGPSSGRLPGADGRCALTKTGGAGAAQLTLVQNGVAHKQTTDLGREPARVQVY